MGVKRHERGRLTRLRARTGSRRPLEVGRHLRELSDRVDVARRAVLAAGTLNLDLPIPVP